MAYANTQGMTILLVRTEKQAGQPLVFKRTDFLTDDEMKALNMPKNEIDPEPVGQQINFSADKTPF